MKLIEKLAQDYSTFSENEYATQEAYIAGFNKAREMAAKEASHVSPWYAVCCRVRSQNIQSNIEMLGEEEVKD